MQSNAIAVKKAGKFRRLFDADKYLLLHIVDPPSHNRDVPWTHGDPQHARQPNNEPQQRYAEEVAVRSVGAGRHIHCRNIPPRRPIVHGAKPAEHSERKVSTKSEN